MELTGVRLEGCVDIVSETEAERAIKYSRIAEKYAPLEIGFTLVVLGACVTYNFLTRPRDHYDKDDDALRFLRTKRGLDLDESKCIQHGVPYASREEEEAGACPGGGGLLRLWRALCGARVPLAVHSPLDVFFLLACFERPRLSLLAPRELSALLRRRLPAGVYDTAHLFDAIGGFKGGRGLSAFAREARERAEAAAKTGALARNAETLAAYGDWAARGGRSKEHEAGYDSLLTAQLFSDLTSIAPERVKEGRNRMYLHMSSGFLDFGDDGRPGFLDFEADDGGVSDDDRASGADREAPRPWEHCVAMEDSRPPPDGIRPGPTSESPPDADELRALHEAALRQFLSIDRLPDADARVVAADVAPLEPEASEPPRAPGGAAPEPDTARAGRLLRGLLADGSPMSAYTRSSSPKQAAAGPDAARLLRGLLAGPAGSCGSPGSASTRCSSPGQDGTSVRSPGR